MPSVLHLLACDAPSTVNPHRAKGTVIHFHGIEQNMTSHWKFAKAKEPKKMPSNEGGHTEGMTGMHGSIVAHACAVFEGVLT